VLADVTQEVEQAPVGQPGAVVDHLGLVGARREVHEPLQLGADGVRVGADLLVGQQVAL
jgi:hypothetical protein